MSRHNKLWEQKQLERMQQGLKIGDVIDPTCEYIELTSSAHKFKGVKIIGFKCIYNTCLAKVKLNCGHAKCSGEINVDWVMKRNFETYSHGPEIKIARYDIWGELKALSDINIGETIVIVIDDP